MADEKSSVVGLRPPFEIVLSPRASVRYGYKDGHVDVTVKIGLFKGTHRIEANEVGKAIDALEKGIEWAKLSQEDRDRIGV